jgi:hypothetical protein
MPVARGKDTKMGKTNKQHKSNILPPRLCFPLKNSRNRFGSDILSQDAMSVPRKIPDKQISEEDSPSKVDKILKDRYGQGLFQFTRCLVDILYLNYLLNVNGTFLDQVLKIIDKLRLDIAKTITRLENIIYDTETDIPYIQRYHLDPFYKELDQLVKDACSLKKPFIRKKGREIRRRNLILLIWSFYIVDPKSKSVEWGLLSDLFQWHMKRFISTPFKKELFSCTLSDKELIDAETSIDAKTIESEVSRLKRKIRVDPELKNYIDRCRSIYFPINDNSIRSTIDIPSLFGKKIYLDIGGVERFGKKPSKRIIFSKTEFLP